MTEKLRVLRVIARMNVGGPAVQASALATRLDPERFESRLLVGSVAPGEADYLELRGHAVPHERVAGLGRAPHLLDDARALRLITRHIRSFRPHIVHTHTAKAGVLGRLAAIRTRVPVTVHTFHGHLLRGYFSPARTRAVVEVERRLAKRTTRLAAVGARVRDDLLAAGIGRAKQYVVVPPGVDLPSASEPSAARHELGLRADASVIAFVGRLTGVKRPDRLLEVVGKLNREREVVTLVVGDGELRAEMEANARNVGGDVRFLGWRADIETVYSAADVVVLTSDNEGMPLSLIEAGLAGRASVTTRVGSAAEVVVDGETGYVTSSATDELAGAVRRLLDDDALRARFGGAAKARAQREFSAARLVRDTEALYEELAAEVATTFS
ncbi:MAG: glycosyltransferase [Actinomycetota bacterium]